VGDRVQTPLGKGVVREVRNHGRLVVEIGGRVVVLEPATVAPLITPKPPARRSNAPGSREPAPRVVAGPVHSAGGGVDLHGLTVEEALVRAEQAVNDALLADLPVLRLIHGRSGGRIRQALHRRLRDIRAVRGFRIDPGNPGVTIVTL
jgi:dsDNA-specific endonuclease/ATPase MutS2